MDPTAGSVEKLEGDIPTLRLLPSPIPLDVAGAVAPRAVVPPAWPANDRTRATSQGLGAWQALQAIYPTARRMFTDVYSNQLAKRVRFSARALLHFNVWREWHGFLTTSPFGRVTDFYPRLHEKPFRPYLHKDLTSRQRCEVLLQHYRFMSGHATKNLVDAVLHNQPFLLNEHSLAELEEPLAINLTYAKHMQQEGELTLSLGRMESLDTFRQHAWIASLTFAVRYGRDGWEMVVGGVQGGQAETGREDAKLATGVFQGMRPKPLLMHVLRQLVACWGISRIYGIRNSSHCLTRQRYRGRITIKSSYDELWQETGGQPTADGYYELPAQQLRRTLESVPSRKRAQYQRRFRLLDGIDAEIRSKFTSTAV
ncbi:MAG TPA: DUF535 family protein [Gammaproteobacteria bacterium]|jgi:hypothetical protein|nr:DUF535 family protein [Gammaproteobacteria bacterium]